MWGCCPHGGRVISPTGCKVSPTYRKLAAEEGNALMPLPDTIKTLIRNAWDDGYPCLVATNGPQGPNITPKGSMIVFDDGHLAWWERRHRDLLDDMGHDKRICVMY